MSFPGTFAPTLFSSAALFDNELSTSFNGVDDTIVMPDNAALNISNNLSMTCWIKTTGTQDASFMSKYKTVGNHRQYLIGQMASGALRALISRDGGSANVKEYRSAELINDGNWHMVALTFATDVLKLYIDGVEINPTKTTDPVVNQMPGGNISAMQMSSIEGNPVLFEFAGNMDEAAIWDTTVLTGTEITTLYNGGSPTDLGDASTTANLSAWWRMGDGDSATTLFDQVGSSDGTLVNMNAGNYVTEVPS